MAPFAFDDMGAPIATQYLCHPKSGTGPDDTDHALLRQRHIRPA